MRLRLPVSRLFAATVLVPTLLSSIYFGLIASDLYTSEARFVLRSPQRQTPTMLGAILQGAGFTRAQDDSFVVHDYVLSRDALQKLDRDLGLRRHFTAGTVDWPSRFAAIDRDDSFEALHRYMQKHIRIEPDPISSITTLRVSAYDAATAHAISEALLQMSEALVNKLNERGRSDLVHFAEREVTAAEERAKAAALAISSFRSQNGVFDPNRQSALQLQLVSKLQDELIAARTQLAQVRALSRESSMVQALELRVRSLQGAIDAENRKVTGASRSLTDSSPEFERLMLDREFADRQLGAAMTALEQARNDAQRKQLYLERLAQPSLPDVAQDPLRIRSVFATLVLGLAVWGILAMLLAGVREHRD
ncbi:MAG: hypothetical protein AB7G13_11210 [Lautropia sp.]